MVTALALCEAEMHMKEEPDLCRVSMILSMRKCLSLPLQGSHTPLQTMAIMRRHTIERFRIVSLSALLLLLCPLSELYSYGPIVPARNHTMAAWHIREECQWLPQSHTLRR